MSGLRRLDLSCNSLENLPGMDLFPSLAELDLSFNKLSSLPIELASLRLTSLKVSYNKLSSLPPALFTHQLGLSSSLEVLHLNDNELDRVPPSLAQCSNLRDLKLNYNKLQNLPLSLSQLQTLQSLDLEGNLLRPTELMALGGDGFSLSRFTQLLALSCPPPPPPSLPHPSLGKSDGSFTIPKASQQQPDASSADVLVLDDAQELQVDGERSAAEETSEHLKDATWSSLSELHLKPRSKKDEDEHDEEERAANDRSVAAALDEVSSLPPAAAAVMYRTLEAVRGGSREVNEGRPLSRGGGP